MRSRLAQAEQSARMAEIRACQGWTSSPTEAGPGLPDSRHGAVLTAVPEAEVRRRTVPEAGPFMRTRGTKATPGEHLCMYMGLAAVAARGSLVKGQVGRRPVKAAMA